MDNFLIDTGIEVNILTKDAWRQMGIPPLVESSNVLFMANKTKKKPIGVL